MKQVRPRRRIDTFDLEPDTWLANKYKVVERLGRGWEGEVYLVREKGTGIERSVKLFFPQRNPGNRTVRTCAKKLHKLRHCPVLIQYRTQEVIEHEGQSVTLLVSDYVDGERLSDFIRRQPGRRLDVFQALHLLHELAVGIECIHGAGEYHGDLHDENVLVNRRGLGFDLRILDLHYRGRPTPANMRQDIQFMVRIFYDILGGRTRYAGHPPEVKAICCGLKTSLIAARFKTAVQLRQHLETIIWTSR